MSRKERGWSKLSTNQPEGDTFSTEFMCQIHCSSASSLLWSRLSVAIIELSLLSQISSKPHNGSRRFNAPFDGKHRHNKHYFFNMSQEWSLLILNQRPAQTHLSTQRLSLTNFIHKHLVFWMNSTMRRPLRWPPVIPTSINPEIKYKIIEARKQVDACWTRRGSRSTNRKDLERYGSVSHNATQLIAKLMPRTWWAAVRKLTGRHHEPADVEGFTAESLNDHYAAISADHSYTSPHRKEPVNLVQSEYTSDWQVFQILDHLSLTASGLDGLPAWFLRLGAPVFCQPVAHLFNLSLTTSTIPQQWKQSSIIPIPKYLPLKHAACRLQAHLNHTSTYQNYGENCSTWIPISNCPISPPPTLSFSDQFAFRPTGSPCAAIIFLLNNITRMLLSRDRPHRYVDTQEQPDAKQEEVDRNPLREQKTEVLWTKERSDKWLHLHHCLDFHASRRLRFSASLPLIINLSASDQVRGVVANSSQTLYALRVLHTYGMSDSALQTIFRSVIVAKVLYACSAWGGFINATDRQRVNAFLRRSIRCGYCSPELPSFEELCQEADKQLFDTVLTNSNHLLHGLLPPPTAASQNYNLRTRAHNMQLTVQSGHLTDSNFFVRMLHANNY